MDVSTVVIGMDAHKRSATIEAMTSDEQILGRGRIQDDDALRQAVGRPHLGGAGLPGERRSHRPPAAHGRREPGGCAAETVGQDSRVHYQSGLQG